MLKKTERTLHTSGLFHIGNPGNPAGIFANKDGRKAEEAAQGGD